jgi:hypothetical protein
MGLASPLAPLDMNTQSDLLPNVNSINSAGGAVTIGLDYDALDEYLRLNPSVDTIDSFLRVLLRSQFIPDDVASRCIVAANLLNSGDFHMVLENLILSDPICGTAVEEIADRINYPPDDDDDTNGPNPQVQIW